MSLITTSDPYIGSELEGTGHISSTVSVELVFK